MAKTIERNHMRQTDAQGKVLREAKDYAGQTTNFRWWLLEDTDLSASVTATILFLKRQQGDRMSNLESMTRLYGSSNLYNFSGGTFGRSRSVKPAVTQRMSFNICESIIDTLESKMAKNKVIPTYITNGGTWDVQKKAKQLTKFAQGLFYEQNIHPKSIDAWSDAAVWGDGFVYVYEDDNKVCVDRALPNEIFVDNLEAQNGHPKQLHRVKVIDRDIALELFPELSEAIETCAPANYEEIGGHETVADMIQVIESWHIRSGPKADDGVHAISIGDGSLKYEWLKDYFPFPHIRYAKRKLGWYGQGACERLEQIQSEINRSMVLKQSALRMQSAFKILLENGSKVVSQHLNNDIGSIIHYSGTPPEYVAPPATNPELQQWIDALISYGYQQEGVSRMVSQGEQPLGVTSGKAMRTLLQTSDDRFLFMTQCMEDFNLEIARQAVEVVRDIHARTHKYEVVFPQAHFMETINWGDINLKEDEYVLKAYPTSSLSDDLPGRLSEIQELAQAGMISPRTARRLMDMPDVEMNDNLSNAAEDLLHKILEDILFDGKYRAPEPFFDLQLAKQLTLEYYNYADYMNAPNDKLALLQKFNFELDTMLGILTPPPMAAPAAAVPGAQGAPSPEQGPNPAALAATQTDQIAQPVEGAA